MTRSKTDIIHVTISPCDHERRIFNEAVTAAHQSYSVKIIALKTPELPEREVINKIPLERISIKNWRGGPLKFLSFNWKLWWKLKTYDYGILHVHDVWVLPGSVLANIFRRGKVIYDAHEYIRGLEIFSLKKVSGLIWKFTERILVHGVHYLIAINEYHREFFISNYPQIPDSGVIKNYPLAQKNEKTDQNKDYRNREAIILFQGILKRGRGLRQAIQAAAYLKQGSLRIIGYGELESELKQAAGTPDIAERIEFKGKVPLEKLLQETGKVRAGLVLFEPLTVNYTYASPNKFFEYVMAGTPLIASDIPTFRQFNSAFEVAILVDPSNITRISEAMDILLTDEERWNRLHQNCLRAREQWNWEAQEQTLLDIYRKFLDT